MPASRMLSAISFGVFCRCAPSTSAIMRSRKVEPCAAVMRTLIQSEITCVPPVTAERSPPLSRMTGADSPVIAASLTDAMPSMTSPSLGISVAGLDQHDVALLQRRRRRDLVRPVAVDEQLGHRLGLGAAQGRRLRLAAPFGDRLGEIGEDHGEPQPHVDLEREAVVAAAGDEVAHEQHRRQRGDDLDARTSPGCGSSPAGSSFLNASPIAGIRIAGSAATDAARLRELDAGVH